MGVWILFLILVALAGDSQGQEIVDLYSGIDSSDVTVAGEAAGAVLRMELVLNGDVVRSREIGLDGPGTWVVRWDLPDPEEGSYDACASLLVNGTPVSRRCYSFLYGDEVPLRFDVRDFRVDSMGVHLSIAAKDPTMADIYYMLLSGDRAIHVAREEAVPIIGTTAQKDFYWKQVLENGRRYSGRVKIVELGHNQMRALTGTFIAADDARITETYQDETGASATVLGRSRVPFVGRLIFVLSRNGTVIGSVEKRTPVLLAGDDETVEVSWNSTLEPGVYHLRTILVGERGDIKDLEENIIEAEPLILPANTTETERRSAAPAGAAALALISAAAFMVWRRRTGGGLG